MRAIYDSTTNFTVDKNIVINTIKADNTDDGTTSKGAGIPTADWNNNKILVNVDIDGNNVSIVVTAAEGDSTYKGSTKWTAITDIIEDWSGEITTTFNGTRVLRVLRQGHQVTFACAISSSSELTSGQTKIIVNLPFTILEWNPTPAYIFNDWTIAGTVYVNLIGTHCLALKPLQTIAANTQIDFTLTCIIK